MIQLLNEDADSYVLRFRDKYFQLAIEDPEYGIGESSKNHKSRDTPVKQKNGKMMKTRGSEYLQSDWDNLPPSYIYFQQLFRTSQNQIIFGANYFTEIAGITFKPPRRKDYSEFINSHPLGWIIWDKMNGTNDFNDCELIWTSFDRPTFIITYMWNGMMQGKSVREGTAMQGNKKLNERRIHPCQKPVQLILHLLKLYAHKSYCIRDFRMGSASSAIASLVFGIHSYIGIEKDKGIYSLANIRYNEYSSRNLLFKPEELC